MKLREIDLPDFGVPEERPELSRDVYKARFARFADRVRALGLDAAVVDALVKRRLGDPFFNVGLNPGHLIHLDEWLNTPIYPGSSERLQSGQALQLDIIPATGTPYFTTNIEDGIALLDEPGRREFAERYPEAWGRVEAHRAFMAEALGIRLKPEVLPFSNLAGYLPPFLLAPKRAFNADAVS